MQNALAAIADEMAATVVRTARSFVVKEALDFSTALFDADGRMIAQGTCLPLHIGAMPYAVAAARRAFDGDIRPGDVYAMNDPWDGSTHLPDIVLAEPIFVDATVIGWAVNTAVNESVEPASVTAAVVFDNATCAPTAALLTANTTADPCLLLLPILWWITPAIAVLPSPDNAADHPR